MYLLGQALKLRHREARAARPRPGRDDKVLADWNGLMIQALVRAAAVFDGPRWLELGRGAFDFARRDCRRAPAGSPARSTSSCC
jgi:uncharacterized protein